MPPANRSEDDHRLILEIREELRELKAIMSGKDGRDGVFTRLKKLECWRDFFVTAIVILTGLSTTSLGLHVPWYFHRDK